MDDRGGKDAAASLNFSGAPNSFYSFFLIPDSSQQIET